MEKDNLDFIRESLKSFSKLLNDKELEIIHKELEHRDHCIKVCRDPLESTYFIEKNNITHEEYIKHVEQVCSITRKLVQYILTAPSSSGRGIN